MCVVNLESVNKLDLTWKQSFLIDMISMSQTSHSAFLYYNERYHERFCRQRGS
jgi:hypothetical protein